MDDGGEAKIYCGIDPSLTGTGVVIIGADSNIQFVETLFPQKIKGVERLLWLRDRMAEIIKIYSPSEVTLEGYSFNSRNQAGVRSTSEWGGVLRLLLYETGMTWTEIPPTVLKKYAAGKGNCPKNELAIAVYRRWGVALGTELADDNQVDAYVLAQIARGQHQDEDLTVFQRQMLAGLGVRA